MLSAAVQGLDIRRHGVRVLSGPCRRLILYPASVWRVEGSGSGGIGSECHSWQNISQGQPRTRPVPLLGEFLYFRSRPISTAATLNMARFLAPPCAQCPHTVNAVNLVFVAARYFCPTQSSPAYPRWEPLAVTEGLCKSKMPSDMTEGPFPPNFKILMYGNSHIRQVKHAHF